MDFVELQFKKAVDTLEKEFIVTSKKQIADNLGLTKQALSEIINGRAKIRTNVLKDFCKFYKINLYWLFYGEGEIFNDDTYKNKPDNKLENLLEKQVFSV